MKTIKRCIALLLIPVLSFTQTAVAQTKLNPATAELLPWLNVSINTAQAESPDPTVKPNVVGGPALAALLLVTAGGMFLVYRHIAKKLAPPPTPPGRYNVTVTLSQVPGINGEYYLIKDPNRPFGAYYVNNVSGFAFWGARVITQTNQYIWVLTENAFGGTHIYAYSTDFTGYGNTNSSPVGANFTYWVYGNNPLAAPYQSLPVWPNYTPANNGIHDPVPYPQYDLNSPVDSAVESNPGYGFSAITSIDPNFYAAWFIIAPNDDNDPADGAALEIIYDASFGKLKLFTATNTPTVGSVLDSNWVNEVSSLWGCVPNLTNASFGFNGSSVASLPNINIQFANGVIMVTRTNTTVTGCYAFPGGHDYRVGDTFTVPGGAGQAAQIMVNSTFTLPGSVTNAIQNMSVAYSGLYSAAPPVSFPANSATGSGAVIGLIFATTPESIRSAPVTIQRGPDAQRLIPLLKVQASPVLPLKFDDDNAAASAAFYLAK